MITTRVLRFAAAAGVMVSLAACTSDSASKSTDGATSASVSVLSSPGDTQPRTSPATEAATAPDASATPASASTADTVAAATPSTPSTTVPWTGPCARPGPAPSVYDHVIWIWMENKNTSKVLDSNAAPFTHALADECGTATHYTDNGIHPSLPNYIAATSGDPQRISDDAPPASHPLTVDNIFRQLRDIAKTARSYEEAMPAPCSLTSTTRYAVKHNPAAYYTGGGDRQACVQDDVSFDQFTADLAADHLPSFSLITPDICNDTHDCPVATGDAWLHVVVTSIIDSTTYRAGATAVFIVYDESEGGGTMPFFAIAPGVAAGTRTDAPLSHYSLLAFTEDALGVTNHLGGALSAPSLAAAFGL